MSSESLTYFNEIFLYFYFLILVLWFIIDQRNYWVLRNTSAGLTCHFPCTWPSFQSPLLKLRGATCVSVPSLNASLQSMTSSSRFIWYIFNANCIKGLVQIYFPSVLHSPSLSLIISFYHIWPNLEVIGIILLKDIFLIWKSNFKTFEIHT